MEPGGFAEGDEAFVPQRVAHGGFGTGRPGLLAVVTVALHAATVAFATENDGRESQRVALLVEQYGGVHHGIVAAGQGVGSRKDKAQVQIVFVRPFVMERIKLCPDFLRAGRHRPEEEQPYHEGGQRMV